MYEAARPQGALHLSSPDAPGLRGLKVLHWRALRAFDAGALADARLLWDRAWTEARHLLDPAHPLRRDILRLFARTHDRLGNYAEAAALQQELIKALQAAGDPLRREAFNARDDLAVIYFHWERFADARAVREPLLAELEAAFGPYDPLTLHVMSNLEGNLLQLGEAEATLTLTRERVRRIAALHPADSEQVLWADNALAYTLSAIGEHDEAIALIREVHQRAVAALGETARLTLDFADSVAGLLQQRGTPADLAEAARIQAQVLELAAASYSPLESPYQEFVFTQARLLQQQDPSGNAQAIADLRDTLLAQLMAAGAEEGLRARVLRRFRRILGEPAAAESEAALEPAAPRPLPAGVPLPETPSFPYLSFAAFLDALRTIHGQVDEPIEEAAVQHTLLTLFEGTHWPPALAQQIRFALTSLGCVSPQLWPTRHGMELLASLSETAPPAAFAAALRPLVLGTYAPLLLSSDAGAFYYTTHEAIDQALQEFQITHSAETARKMRTFFVHACQAAGIPLPETVNLRRRTVTPRARPADQIKPVRTANGRAAASPALVSPGIEDAPQAIRFLPLLATFDLSGLLTLPPGQRLTVQAADGSAVTIERTADGLTFHVP